MRLVSPTRERFGSDEERPPSFLTELLFPLPASRRSVVGIVTWWESRRLLYNVIVGATGLVTLGVVAIADAIAPTTGHLPNPLAPLLGVLGYGFMANLCYTLGPIIEITLERVWKDRVLPVGPALFRQGLAFSIGLTLLPIPLVIVVEMGRLLNFLFLHW